MCFYSDSNIEMYNQYSKFKINQMHKQMNMLNQMAFYPNIQIANFPLQNSELNYLKMNMTFENKRTNPIEFQRKERFISFYNETAEKQEKDSFTSIDNNNGNNNNKKNNYFYMSNIQVKEGKINKFQNFINTREINIIEYLCTQRGTKEIEKFIKKSPNECITILINHLNIFLPKIMTDIYGNYFCQNIIKLAAPRQILLLLKYISKDFVLIAENYSGTHVLQTLLNIISTDAHEAIILSSIKGAQLEMAYDDNATHVLQKIVQCIKEPKRLGLNRVILLNIRELCLNSNGICLVKKYIATNIMYENKLIILKTLTENCLELSQNPFGNYVIQYIIEKWGKKECENVINIIIENICLLSKQKFSSNVVEKVIEFSDVDMKEEIFGKFCNESKLIGIIKNKFGKYVLQKSFKYMTVEQKGMFLKAIKNIKEVSDNKDKKILYSFIESVH